MLIKVYFILSDYDNKIDDTISQYDLGSSYDGGHIDYRKAKYWYELSLAQGNLDA